jgi:hypothetical protein
MTIQTPEAVRLQIVEQAFAARRRSQSQTGENERN